MGTDSNGKQTKRLKSNQKDLCGKNFHIYMELNNKNSDRTCATVLLKAPMTSIFKNRFSFIDNMLGESLIVLTKEIYKLNIILFCLLLLFQMKHSQ